MSIESSFTALLERTPTDADRQRLYRVRDAMGIKDNDALWTIVMALDHYTQLYEKIPGQIGQTTAAALASVKQTADAVMAASSAQVKADLSKAVADAAQRVAVNASRKEMWKWSAGCIVLASACICALLYFAQTTAYQAGLAAGTAAGYQTARTEKAAASWANTPQGAQAYGLAKLGSLDALARCEHNGWYRKNGICYAYPDKGKTYTGWRVE
jgi:hypothetical protein